MINQGLRPRDVLIQAEFLSNFLVSPSSKVPGISGMLSGRPTHAPDVRVQRQARMWQLGTSGNEWVGNPGWGSGEVMA